MNFPPTFVISLAESPERREWMGTQLNKLGIPYNFFDAVDGRQMDVPSHPAYNAAKRRAYFGRDLTGGELGCTLSHKTLYEKLIAENIPVALILEDDAILNDDFPAVLKDLMTKTDHFDIVRFLGSPKVMKRGGRKVIPLVKEYWLTRLPTTPGGSHATLVTLKGVQKIYPHMTNNPYPIDALLARGWKTGANWLSVQPGLAVQELSFENTIGETRFDKKSNQLRGWQRKLFPVTRAWFKISEAIGKKWFYWSHWAQDKRAGHR